MDKLALGDTGRTTSRLGFGCSSLMGAVGRRESLKLLEAAFDAGVRHFDVAPMYGYGEAEACLSEFLSRHRGETTVTTKYGIPPGKRSGILSVAKRLARPVVKVLPGIKKRIASAATSMTQSGLRSSFTALEAKQSLQKSLAALRTDRIDLWLLHEVTAADLQDEGLLRLLEEEMRQGTIGGFGVGSEASKIPALLSEREDYCRTLQFEWSVLDAPVHTLDSFTIHHRSLTSRFRELHDIILQDQSLCEDWSAKVGADLASSKVLAGLMFKAALAMNPGSVLLFSSKSVRHIEDNVSVENDVSLEEPARRLYRLVQAERERLPLQGP